MRISGAAALIVLATATSASAATFDDPTPNTGYLPWGATPAAWNVYPMQLPVAGLEGSIARVTVTLKRWTQDDAALTDAVLQSPQGTFVKVVSDVGGEDDETHDAYGLTVVFDDDAASSLPSPGPLGLANTTITRKPTDRVGIPDSFPGLPAAANSAPARLSTFVGEPPNGTWKLHLATGSGNSFFAGDGTIAGWALDIQTVAPPPDPRVEGETPASPVPVPVPSGSAAVSPPPDRAAPLVSRVAADGARMRPAARGGEFGTSGVRLGFRLNEPAQVAFDVDRLVAGRRAGRRCVAARARGARCTRVVPVPGQLVFAAKAGDNVLRFTGRVGGRALGPGRYRLTGVATDAAGNAARPFSVVVTILRRR